MHSDATPLIAHMEFRVTRSNTDSSNALTVNIDIDHKGFRRSDATDRAETIVIAAGATSATKEFPAQFDLNTPGNVAATVAGGDDHLPALAPNNAASVQMKVPASGRSVTVSHQTGAYTVEEGDTLTVTVTFATAAGVAQPRESVAYLLSTEQDTAVSNQDYTAKSAQRTLPSSAWTEEGGVYTATATETFDTIEDSIYEGSLQFKVELGMSPIGPVCPPGTADGTFCEATVTITDDEEEPGVVLSKSVLNLTEGGESGSYTIRLAAQPTTDVYVRITGGQGSDLTINNLRPQFTTENWNVEQTINVSAGHDDDLEMDVVVLSHRTESTQDAYNVLDGGTVTVNVTDDDTLGVTGVEVTSTPTGGYYNSGEAITFKATFNGSVTVDTTNGTPRFAFDIGGQTRHATYTSGSPSTELTFSYTVAASDEDHDGISWAANALDRNGGTIKFTTTVVADREDASLAHAAQGALSAHKVDAKKPTLSSATVNATTMKLEFSEELNTTAPALAQFSGKKTPRGGSETDLAFTGTPSIAGRVVTLTLASGSSVTAADTDVKVSYTKPSNNPIQDLAGNEADAFTDSEVLNELADNTAPTVHGTTGPALAADGLTLTITFSEAMNESSTPAASAFTVEATPQGGNEATFALASTDGVTVDGSTVVLKLEDPIVHDDASVKVSYAKPGSGSVLQDANRNDLANFTDRSVTNNSAVPRVSIAAVYEDASTFIASPVVRATLSTTLPDFDDNNPDLTSGLLVYLTVDQADDYVTDSAYDMTVQPGESTGEQVFDFEYAGNVSGNLVYTLAPHPEKKYRINLAENTATVMVKAPASGLPVNATFGNRFLRVNEGDAVEVSVVYEIPAGLAEPRDSGAANFSIHELSAIVDEDYEGETVTVRVPAGDWEDIQGGGKTQTVTFEVQTLEDTDAEAHETFTVEPLLHRIVYGRATGWPAEPIEPSDESDPDYERDLAFYLDLRNNERLAIVNIIDDDALEGPTVEVISEPTGGFYYVGDAILFELVYPYDMVLSGGPPTFAFELGGATRHAVYSAAYSQEYELVFVYTVASTDSNDDDGISWAANAVTLNGATLQVDEKDTYVARTDFPVTHEAQTPLSGHKVKAEAAPPVPIFAVVDGTTLHVLFSQDLDTTKVPANTDFSGKKTPSGSAETDLAFTGTPDITGSTLTLTLTSATEVTATDGDVKLSYTKPDTNPISRTSGEEAAGFTDLEVINALADTRRPRPLSRNPAVLAADGVTLTITFDEILDESSTPAATAFTVEATPQGGSEGAVDLAATDGVTVSENTVILKLDAPIAHVDTGVKVSYAKPGSGAVLEDLGGNEASSLYDQAVTNNSAIPRVSIEAVHPDATPLIAHMEFRVTRSNTDADNDLTVNVDIDHLGFLNEDSALDRAQTIVIAAGATSATKEFPALFDLNTPGNVTATVEGGDDHLPALAPNNEASVQMKAPTSGRSVTVSHQRSPYTVEESDTLTVTVTFATAAGVAQPRESVQFSLATIAKTATVNQDYTAKSAQRTLPSSAWTESGGVYTASATETFDTIDDSIYEGSLEFFVALDLEYTSPVCPPGTAFGASCHATVTITDDDTLGVTGVEVTSTPTGGYYNSGEAITFEATFNGSVTVDTTNGTPRFAFDVGGQTRYATYTSGSPSTELTFSYTVAASDEDHDGISWAADALDRNGGTIKFTTTVVADREDASLAHAAQGDLSAHKVDARKPTLVSATVNATTMRLEFNEDLNTTAPALAQFSGKKTPSGSSETDLAFTGTPSIAESTVTLTLASGSSVTSTDIDVKVSYSKPSNNPIKDLEGNEADGFTDFEVMNALADTVAPTLHGTTTPVLAADGVTLTITFNEAMKTTSTPAASAFTVKATPQGGSEQSDLATDATVTVEGSTVKLVLAKPIAHNDASVKVNYSKPGSGSVLEDLVGNDLASFGDQDVTNGSLIPRVSVTALHADATPGLAHAGFRVTRSNIDPNNALTVTVDITQTDTYTGDTSWDIDISAGSDSGELTSSLRHYGGNTSGNLTATVSGAADHLPHLTDNSATVQVKVPASGLHVTFAHSRTTVSVTEGGTVNAIVNVTAAAGVARPRDLVGIALNVLAGTAVSPGDFGGGSDPILVDSGDWSASSGGGWTASKTVQVNTIDDDEYEGDETFTMVLIRNVETRLQMAGVGWAPGTETATVTIKDNETLGVTGVAVTSTPTSRLLQLR